MSEEGRRRQAEAFIDEHYPDCGEESRRMLIENWTMPDEESLLRLDDEAITIKNYFDFIQNYHLHPELKYDDSEGEPCGRLTRGLLQRTHVIAKEIKFIGKEAETLQDAEEFAILPEEENLHKKLLEYGKDRERGIDAERWKEIREFLKENAKPRREWADKLGVSLRYFKQLLAGERYPSKETYLNVIDLLTQERVRIPDGKEPMPRTFQEGTRGNVRDLWKLACALGMAAELAKKVFHEHIFRLNGREYVDISGDFVRMYVEGRLKWLRTKLEENKQNGITGLEACGFYWKGEEKEYENFAFDDVLKVRAKKIFGRNRANIQVKLKSGKILNVLQKDNGLAFKLKLFPKPEKIMTGEPEIYENKGYKTYFYPWQDYNSWISVYSASEHYKVDINEIKSDIKGNKFKQSEVKKEKGRIFINSLTAWKIYGRELNGRCQ
ncbi:MAG: hypothetical protein QXM86_00155 [Candidatus Bathyarchaeia archaeon]